MKGRCRVVRSRGSSDRKERIPHLLLFSLTRNPASSSITLPPSVVCDTKPFDPDYITITKMDYGAQFTEREKEAMQVEARKELEEEGELKRLTTEVEEAVAAQVKAEAEVAALEDAELAADVGAELEPLDDEVYFSDEETGAKAVATAEDGADENDSLDGAPITDGLITPGSTVSYPPTPLDSPLASIEEDLEDEGFVDSDSIPEITPEGSTDEIQTGSELDESLIGPLPYDDDGMSAEDIEKQDQKMRRRMVKLELKALAEREEREMKEAAGKSVSTGNEGRGFAL